MGYFYVILRRDNRSFARRVHRLVLEAFISSCPKGMQCCHNDGDSKNNKLENLRWDTPRNNQLDRLKHKPNSFNHFKGEKHRSAKLNEQQVRVIKKLKYLNDRPLQKDIAAIFNISGDTISGIWCNRVWKDI